MNCRSWIATLLLLGASATACADETLPGIGAVDHRVEVDVQSWPWRAIGRLQSEFGARCTASLVGPRLALTAAHCLVNRHTGHFQPPEALHLVFGYAREKFLAHTVVDHFVLGPGYDLAKPVATIASDWALLTLTDDLGTKLGFFHTVSASVGTPILNAGYTIERNEVLLADLSCHVTVLSPIPGLIADDCQATFGASGGPLLEKTSAGYTVVGVRVAITGNKSGQIERLAVPATSFAAAIGGQPAVGSERR